jgi:hypothetical protein
MRIHSIIALLGMSATGAGCVIIDPGPEPGPQRDFESFRIDWGFGEVALGADQSGSLQLDADGTLRLDTPCMEGVCDRMAPGSYQAVVSAADRDAAVAVLTDPDLTQLLARESSVCAPVEDVDEIMTLTLTDVEHSNQTVLCDNAPIVAARAALSALVEEYFVLAPPAGAPVLVSAGWSFGHCLGQCVGELAVDGSDLRFTITGRLPEDPVYLDNTGTLTELGEEALRSAQAALAGEALEERYGCPDCADGGASHVTLARDGEVSTHTYEFSNPPAVLTELDALLDDLMGALESCSANGFVEITADCTPRAAE